jgi:hypothetical protein
VEDSAAQGFGKCVYANGDSYEGYWLNSKPHGLGVYVWKSSGRYEGEFFEGLMHGVGKREFVWCTLEISDKAPKVDKAFKYLPTLTGTMESG